MYFKDFDKWNRVKKRISKEERKVYIRAGEIRWAASKRSGRFSGS